MTQSTAKKSAAKKSSSSKKAQATETNKRKVVMRSVALDPASGETLTYEAVDYVPLNMLDAYEADAKTRWQHVSVDRDTPDAGPGGVDGPTETPAHLANRAATDFAKYGDASSPDNALDDHLAANPPHPED